MINNTLCNYKRIDFRAACINNPELKLKICDIVFWVVNHETEFGKGPDFTKELNDFDNYEQDVLLSALEIFPGWNFYIRNNHLIGKCKFK